MLKSCDECAYGSIDEFGDRGCNYRNINPSGECVQDIIARENREYEQKQISNQN